MGFFNMRAPLQSSISGLIYIAGFRSSKDFTIVRKTDLWTIAKYSEWLHCSLKVKGSYSSLSNPPIPAHFWACYCCGWVAVYNHSIFPFAKVALGDSAKIHRCWKGSQRQTKCERNKRKRASGAGRKVPFSDIISKMKQWLTIERACGNRISKQDLLADFLGRLQLKANELTNKAQTVDATGGLSFWEIYFLGWGGFLQTWWLLSIKPFAHKPDWYDIVWACLIDSLFQFDRNQQDILI